MNKAILGMVFGILAMILSIVSLVLQAHGQVLLFDNFQGGQVNPLWSTPLVEAPLHYQPFTTQKPVPELQPGVWALNYYALVGTNEQAPLSLRLGPAQMAALFGSDPSEVYLEWSEYFANYCFPTGSQKIARIFYDNASFPASKKEYGMFVQASNTDININALCGLWGNVSKCFVDVPIHSDQPHPQNTVVKWGFHVKLNTPGQNDGALVLRKDGAVFLQHTGNLRGNDTKGLNGLWIGGNYSQAGGVGGLGCSASRFIGPVTIARTPGSIPPQPTPVPTVRPTSAPTPRPSAVPTASPTARPTPLPTATPKPKCTCTCKVVQ